MNIYMLEHWLLSGLYGMWSSIKKPLIRVRFGSTFHSQNSRFLVLWIEFLLRIGINELKITRPVIGRRQNFYNLIGWISHHVDNFSTMVQFSPTPWPDAWHFSTFLTEIMSQIKVHTQAVRSTIFFHTASEWVTLFSRPFPERKGWPETSLSF